ncbi:MAG: hypothetical protein ACP5SH_25445 [Syntrophobacteraceae bacterium]
MEEQARYQSTILMGWKAIAAYLQLSERTMRNRKYELLQGDFIFIRRTAKGKRIICAWPEDLRRWSKKSSAIVATPTGVAHGGATHA